ncbi:Elongator complex protein 4 [Scenedesmus sp. NREL 46B-D3]|nr:Elongator complex protein 4 [Scenedesmus sp. NREL 46B-D3]
MSAFIRRQPGTAGSRTPLDLGTRPGLHGQVLISTGLAGLDRLLGGGLPLGSILLLLEDSNSQQHLNLMKCFMAEGVCCKHSVAWVTAQQLTPDSTAAFLPDQARSGSSSISQPAQQVSSTTSSAGTAAAGGSAAAPDDGLKIAWQYRKYIQSQQRAEPVAPDKSRTSSSNSSSTQASSSKSSSSSSSSAAKNVAAGIGREWCRQYDLTKGLTPAQLAGTKFTTCCCTSRSEGSGAVAAAGAAAAGFVQRFQPSGPIPIPSQDPGSIGRLVIQSLGSPDWWPSSSSSSSSSLAGMEAGILCALADLRLQIQDATCAALVMCPAELFSESFQARLQHLADAVLRIQCLADNTDVYRLLPDASSASALLEVRRLPHLGLLRQRHIEDQLYLIRHKRRSISISVLDLLPLEAVEQQQGAAEAAKKEAPVKAVV